jgi:PAS domain S-box-containing protein
MQDEDKHKIKGQPINEVETAEVKYKKTDALLRMNEEHYQTLLDTIPHGIQEIDASGIIVFVNKAYNRIYGYEEGEVIGKSMLDKLADDSERKKLSDYLKTLVKDQPAPTPYFERDRTKEGRILDVQLDWNYKRDDKRRVVGFISVITDITERKQVEDALKKSEEKYRELITHAKDAIFSINRDGSIIEFNKKAEELFGYTREEIMGKHASLLSTPLQRKKEGKRMLKFKETTLLEIEKDIMLGKGLRKDGQEFPIEFSVYALELSGGYIATTIVRDITERKQAEQKLTNYQKELRSLASQITLSEEKERRCLADYIHDEIGQQLFGMKIKLEILKDSLSSTEHAKTLDNLLNNIQQMIDNARSLTVEFSPPILYELGLEKALEWLAEQTHNNYGIMVTFEDDKREKPLDDDVKIFLYQAVRELFTNVKKHAQVKNARLSIKKDNSNIRICVEDDGIGFTYSNRELSKDGKKGFGLFSIKERLDHFGGHLEIESQPNRGTHITLVIPLIRSVEGL